MSQNIETTKTTGKNVIAVFNNCQYQKNIGSQTHSEKALSLNTNFAQFTLDITFQWKYEDESWEDQESLERFWSGIITWAEEKEPNKNQNHKTLYNKKCLNVLIIYQFSNKIK